MISYAVTGGSESSSVANITVDTPSVIFSLDPLFAMLDFASAPFKDSAATTTDSSNGARDPEEGQDTAATPSASQGLAFRVNVVQASVKLLADPSRSDSEAIVLSIRQVQLAQQGTLVLSVDHMGIFLCKMDKQKETIRILDDFDLNLSMDNRADNGSQNSSIELDLQALVLRLSMRDITLATSIVSRAIELSGASTSNKEDKQIEQPRRPVEAKRVSQVSTNARRRASAPQQPKAELLATRESVRILFSTLVFHPSIANSH
jgi:vacuolar protein sorting-associated protein 13A/C